ncbi:MAG: aldo/keto reductase [Bacteroidales bacterium]|nr:aldo/keto reductase [Bacteroidales bacterium]MCF8336946.1 aldo/keto reductase [Bacteroidales bacterium]
MEYQSKLKLSPVVAGTMSYGKGGKELSAGEVSGLIRKTYETGITSFDMADIYGDYTTEALFGESWKKAGIAREKVQLVS